MDHDTAVRSNATESYILGELSGEDRDGFEEHFFLCPECAEDVRALTVFAANARAVFRREAAPAVHAGILWSGRALWLSVGLNVALLLGVGYGWRELSAARAPQYVQDIAVLGVARSAGNVREISRSTRRIVFSFYLPGKFESIGYELKDDSGVVRARQILPAPPKEDSAESHISLSTADLKAGGYEIGFWGAGSGGQTPIGQSRFRIAGE